MAKTTTPTIALEKHDGNEYYDVLTQAGNMDKIDAEVAALRKKVIKGTLTTTNASWVASGDVNLPYKKNVAISGVLATDVPMVNFNLATLPVALNAGASYVESYAGGITLFAFVVPSASLTYDYTIMRG